METVSAPLRTSLTYDCTTDEQRIIEAFAQGFSAPEENTRFSSEVMQRFSQPSLESLQKERSRESSRQCTTEEQSIIEAFAQNFSAPEENTKFSSAAIQRGNISRRVSQTALNFFQNETRQESSQRNDKAPTRRTSFLALDGKIQDDYIARRASLNSPINNNSLEDTVPSLADLSQAKNITKIDGNVLAQLFLSGYAKLGTKVDYLNKINVFPIADGDTGANMKVCLKLPSRNLFLDPSPSALRVASNMAADVLLNGQGNSGTILSHFYVSLAEEIRNLDASLGCHEALTIDQFASCLVKVGGNMALAVPNPVEGTLLSVARDSCEKLAGKSYSNLQELLDNWREIAHTELAATPDKLIVDGVRVLEKAGVVDSGAQGFVYTIEGMWLASKGQLPEASDPRLFQTATQHGGDGDDDLRDVVDDHNVCDSKYQFCTEAVILLKDGVQKEEVMDVIDYYCQEIQEGEEVPLPPTLFQPSRYCSCRTKEPLGDSIACVHGPAKEGGNLLKIHIHTNEPQQFFDTIRPYSKDPIFKKEKVEDMYVMRDLEHGATLDGPVETQEDSIENAQFTMIGLTKMCLPPTIIAENNEILGTFPMFLVPADTNEPIDIRYPKDTEVLQYLNKQRNPATAVGFTTATSTPMQMKIELLSMLAKGKPVLVIVFSTDKKLSAYGRNVLQAIDMLEPQQQSMVKVFVHGWGTDAPFLIEAIRCARKGQSIDEAIEVCTDLADRTFGRVAFTNAELFRKMKKWRPHLYPDGFSIPEGHHSISGTAPGIRENGISFPDRMQTLVNSIDMGTSLEDAFEKAARHIKSGLKPGQRLGNILIPCVGRPDYGHLFIQKLRDEGIEIVGTPNVYSEGMVSIVMGAWGSLSLTYQIMEA